MLKPLCSVSLSLRSKVTLNNYLVASTADYNLTFLHLLQTSAHSVAAHGQTAVTAAKAGERVMALCEETGRTCECASLCVKERQRGDEKTKWEKRWCNDGGNRERWKNVEEEFLPKGHRWCWLGADGLWFKYVSPPVYIKEGIKNHYW